MKLKAPLLALLTLLIVSFCFPQELKTVVYLKSGRIITGKLVEMIPDVHVKILTTENVTHTISYTDISYIGNEKFDYYYEEGDSTHYARRITFGLFAGVAFPADYFGAVGHPSDGYANIGSIIGGEIGFPLFRTFYLNLSGALLNNGVNVDGLRENGIPASVEVKTDNWNSFWFMPGIRSQSTIDNVTFFAALNYGWMKVLTPMFHFSGEYSGLNTPSGSITTSAFSFCSGMTIFGNATVSFRYYYSKPIIPVNVMTIPSISRTNSGAPVLPEILNYEQPISIYCFTAGVSF